MSPTGEWSLAPVYGTTEVERSIVDPLIFSSRFAELDQSGLVTLEYVWTGATGTWAPGRARGGGLRERGGGRRGRRRGLCWAGRQPANLASPGDPRVRPLGLSSGAGPALRH